MPSDQQVSILVDIASGGGARLPPERLNDLMDLVAGDYVEGEEGDGKLYKLTSKGQRFLSERGVGVNES